MVLSALSSDQSILAIYNNSSSSNSRVLIKCFDAKVSLGSLKYTLSAKTTTSLTIAKITFVSSDYLVASTDENSVLVFDLHRGVLSQTIQLPSPHGTLCDIASSSSTNDDSASLLYALSKNDGKTLVGVYDLSNNGKLVRKIKTGSCDDEHETLSVSAIANTNADQSHDILAVRIGKKVKLVDTNKGSVMGKLKIKTNDAEDAATTSTFITASPDGKILATNTSHHLHYFAVEPSGNNKDGGVKNSLECKSLGASALSIAGASSPTIVNGSKGEYAMVATDGTTASLLLVKSSNSKKTTVKPFAHMKADGSDASKENTNLDAFISGTDAIMMEVTSQGLQNVSVDMSRVSWENSKGNINIYPKEENDDGEDGGDGNNKKRKIVNKNVVLGPGEAGGEALTVTDLSSHKRAKHNDEDGSGSEDDFVLPDDEEDAEGSTTIAQRLALLSSELDRDDDDSTSELLLRNKTNFAVKGATSDSLVILLTQALMANDDSQLEVAFQVSDKKVIENSILALAKLGKKTEDGDADADAGEEVDGSACILMLLTKLVTRISRKPTRAQQLSFWIRTVLVALITSADDGSMKMGNKEKDVAARLAPLRSMLSERVESLPALLRLEGRLGLIGKQF